MCSIAGYLQERHAVLYFGEPIGRVKTQATSKNIPQNYIFNRLIRDLLSNMFSFQNYELFWSRALGGTKAITNNREYLYSFGALFVLY